MKIKYQDDANQKKFLEESPGYGAAFSALPDPLLSATTEAVKYISDLGVQIYTVRDVFGQNAPDSYKTMKTPAEDFEEVGQGSIDFPCLLKAASKEGVVNCYVEQDQNHANGDPLTSLKISYEHLKQVNL